MIINKKIALIEGGFSVEKEISLMTSRCVQKALKELEIKFKIFEADSSLSLNLSSFKPDIAFLATHGPYGEDGTLQGLLEFLKIPYTGSGVLSSSLCMDKIFFKKWIQKYSYPTPKYLVFKFENHFLNFDPCEENKEKAFNFISEKEKYSIQELASYLSYPCVVKPSKSGSSLGVSLCASSAEFEKAVNEVTKIDCHLLIEELIIGKEIAGSWLNGQALTPIEIRPQEGFFYDFKRKYKSSETKYLVPAELSSSTLETLKVLTKEICNICNIRTYARVDYIVNHKEDIFILEANTLPGLTSHSLLPKSAAYDGMDYNQVILEILKGATLDYVK